MKKILLGLLLFLCVGFINFSSAGSYTYTGTVKFSGIYSSPNAGGYRSFFLPIPAPVLDYSVSSSIGSQLSDVNCDFILVDNPYGVSIDHVKLNVEVRSFTSNNSYSSGNDYLTNGHFYKYIGDWTALGGLRYFTFYFYYSYSSNSEGNVTMSFSCTFSGDNIINQSDLNYTCPECPSCSYTGYIAESDVTENYCTNKFSSLIPESDITAGYCETEFGMIDPVNCPSSGGTGDVLWSAFWVNDRQIQGASNIFLYLPDFLNWDYTYLNSGSTLQVDVTNEGDTQYIEDILTVQTYHPSSEDFTYSFTGTLTLLMPYIIITLFILFVWRLLRKIFK